MVATTKTLNNYIAIMTTARKFTNSKFGKKNNGFKNLKKATNNTKSSPAKSPHRFPLVISPLRRPVGVLNQDILGSPLRHEVEHQLHCDSPLIEENPPEGVNEILPANKETIDELKSDFAAMTVKLDKLLQEKEVHQSQ